MLPGGSVGTNISEDVRRDLLFDTCAPGRKFIVKDNFAKPCHSFLIYMGVN